MAVAPVTPAWRFAGLTAVLAALVAIGLWSIHRAREGEGVPTRSGGLTPASLSVKNRLTSFAHPVTLVAGLLLVVALYVFFATVIGSVLTTLITGLSYGDSLWPTARVVLLGLASIAFTVPLIVLWLRYLERRDSSHDAPPVDERLLREMVRREDWIAQNHMGIDRPRSSRVSCATIIIRAGHLGLGLLAQGHRDGRLSRQHAHRPFRALGVPQQRQPPDLLQQFRSELGKLSRRFHREGARRADPRLGLRGRLPADALSGLDGASHGRQVQGLGAPSRAVSRFWYSAYRDLTVDQIERNTASPMGCAKPTMSEQEATAWMRDL